MSIAMPRARGERGQRRSPRVNAPIRRQPRSGSAADVVLTLAFATMTMAGVIFAASLAGEAITTGEAGPALARIFAGSLAVMAFVAFLLGLTLLRESTHIGLRLAFAGFLGIVIGIVQTVLYLEMPGMLLAIPPLFALLAVRQSREWFLKGIGLLSRGDALR